MKGSTYLFENYVIFAEIKNGSNDMKLLSLEVKFRHSAFIIRYKIVYFCCEFDEKFR